MKKCPKSTPKRCVNLSYHSDTSLTPMIVAKLIKQLPKLLSIEGYQRTGEAIALLHSIMKQETPTKLQYVHDRKTKFQSLCAIQALCPGKKIYFPSISYYFHIPKIFLNFFPHTGKNRNRRKSNLLP